MSKRVHIKFVNGTSDFIDCDEYSTGDKDFIVLWRDVGGDNLPTFVNKNHILYFDIYILNEKKRLTPADGPIGKWQSVP